MRVDGRLLVGLVLGLNCPCVVVAQDNASETSAAAPEPKPAPGVPPVETPKALEPLFAGATALNPQKSVYLDKANGRLLLKTRVCLREGILEMLICKAKTKEHESVLTIDTDAYVVHAALLALGAKAGRPVRFQPEYHPPEGERIDIRLNWVDAEGKAQRVEGQKWVRGMTRRYFVEPLEKLPEGLKLAKDSDLKYDPDRKEIFWFGTMSLQQLDILLKLSDDEMLQAALRKIHKESQPREMDAEFIFGGSGFHEAKDGTKYYMAEGGNLVCVANFSDAMIDVSIRSSDVNAEASFEPYTERIPPLGTPVIVELIPAKADAKKAE
jgi:hypothetical protein